MCDLMRAYGSSAAGAVVEEAAQDGTGPFPEPIPIPGLKTMPRP